MFKYLWVIILGVADLLWFIDSVADTILMLRHRKRYLEDSAIAFWVLHCVIVLIICAISFGFFISSLEG